VFTISEIGIAGDPATTLPEEAILIALSCGGGFAIAEDFVELAPGYRTLIIVPLAPVIAGRNTLAVAPARFLPAEGLKSHRQLAPDRRVVRGALLGTRLLVDLAGCNPIRGVWRQQ
jgi:hypothetical protein